MEEEIREISEVEPISPKSKLRLKEHLFVPLLSLLIAGWAYAFNSPTLALISAFAMFYPILRYVTYRIRRKHYLGSYEEQLMEEESEGRWDVIGGIWVAIVFGMLIALSINSSNRFAQPGSRRYHIYKDCVMINKHKELKQYSYDADTYIMRLTLCQECNIKRIRAHRAWEEVNQSNIQKKKYKSDRIMMHEQSKEGEETNNINDEELEDEEEEEEDDELLEFQDDY